MLDKQPYGKGYEQKKKKTCVFRTSRYLSTADLSVNLHVCLSRLNASQEG